MFFWVLLRVNLLFLVVVVGGSVTAGESKSNNTTSPDVALVSYLLSRGFPFREMIKMRLLSQDDFIGVSDDVIDRSTETLGSEEKTTQGELSDPSLVIGNSTVWWHRFISPDSHITKIGLQIISKFLEVRQWVIQNVATKPNRLSEQMFHDNEGKNDARAASSVDELRAILSEILTLDSEKSRRRQQGEALVLLSQWRLFFDSEFLPLSALFEAVPQSLLNVSGIVGQGPRNFEMHSLNSFDDAIRCMAAGVSLMHDSLIEVYSSSEYMARMLMQEKQEEIRKRQEEDRMLPVTEEELVTEDGLLINEGSPLSPPPSEAMDMELVQAITNWVSANPGKPWPSDELLQQLSLEFDLNSLGLDSNQAIFDFVRTQVDDPDVKSETPTVVKPEDEFGNAYIFLNNRGEVWQPPTNLYVNGPYLSPTADDVSSIGAELFVHTSRSTPSRC